MPQLKLAVARVEDAFFKAHSTPTAYRSSAPAEKSRCVSATSILTLAGCCSGRAPTATHHPAPPSPVLPSRVSAQNPHKLTPRNGCGTHRQQHDNVHRLTLCPAEVAGMHVFLDVAHTQSRTATTPEGNFHHAYTPGTRSVQGCLPIHVDRSSREHVPGTVAAVLGRRLAVGTLTGTGCVFLWISWTQLKHLLCVQQRRGLVLRLVRPDARLRSPPRFVVQHEHHFAHPQLQLQGRWMYTQLVLQPVMQTLSSL